MSTTRFKIPLLASPVIHVFLIVLLAMLAYSNTFKVPFAFDDGPNIVDNPLIKDFKYFRAPSKANQIALPVNVVMGWKTRRVGYLSFAINYAINGLEVRGYHAVNLAIHIINALLVYWLVLLTFRTPGLYGTRFREHSRYVALFSALLFVSHPLQTQAITYTVQRLTSLATLFYLLSLTLYIRYMLNRAQNLRSMTLFSLSVISAVLAMKTKEIAFTLPLVIALYEFVFFRASLRSRLLYLAPFFLTMLIIPLSLLDIDRPLGEIIYDVGETTKVKTTMPRLDYLFTEFRVIATYLRLMALPMNQNLDYVYPICTSFLEPQVFLSFVLLASIFALGFYLLHRSRKADPSLKVIAFGIFWFFTTISVESSLIPIVDVIFEHRLYLPSVGAFMAVGALALLILNKLRLQKIRTVGIALFIIVPIIFSIATYRRNTVWGNEISLWEDVVRKSPEHVRAHLNLGYAYQSRGLHDKAIEYYQKALRLKNPFRPEFYLNIHYDLGVLYNAKGLPDKAIKHFHEAINIDPDNYIPHMKLGMVYREEGMYDKAIEHFQAALKLNPKNLAIHLDLGDTYERAGQLQKASEHYRIADELKRTREK